MEKILEKLDSYRILNNLLPGIAMSFLCEKAWGITVVEGSFPENFFIYYFIGMVVSRTSSVVVEPICKAIKLVKYTSHDEYAKASKIDTMIKVLSESNNSYRAIFTACLIALLGKLIIIICSTLNITLEAVKLMLLLLVTVLFAAAYRKQTKYVVDRVRKTNEAQQDEINKV